MEHESQAIKATSAAISHGVGSTLTEDLTDPIFRPKPRRFNPITVGAAIWAPAFASVLLKGWPIAIALFVTVPFISGSAAYLSWRNRQVARHFSRLDELLDSGQLEVARLEHRLALHRFRYTRDQVMVLLYCYASILSQQGKHRETAIVLSELVSLSGLRKRQPRFYVQFPFTLSATYELVGNRAESDRWFDEAHRRANEPQMHSLRQTHRLHDYAKTIRQCRRCLYSEAVRELDNDWKEIEIKVDHRTIRELRLLRAFARTRSSSGPVASEVYAELRDLGPNWRREFAGTASGWGDLEAFFAETITTEEQSV